MSETLQRRFIMLLCLQNNNDLKKLTPDEIAFALRITPEELSETQKIFIKKGFIDDEFTILNWDKRQYISDNSTQRVRKHRQKQDETLQKRSETVTVTPPEQNRYRTDTEQIQKKKIPIPKDFTVSDRVKKWADEKGYVGLKEHLDSFKLSCTAKGYKYVDWDSAFMKAIRDNWAKVSTTTYKDPYASALGGN